MTYVWQGPFKNELVKLSNQEVAGGDFFSLFKMLGYAEPIVPLFAELFTGTTLCSAEKSYALSGMNLTVLQQPRAFDKDALSLAAYVGFFKSQTTNIRSQTADKPDRFFLGATIGSFSHILQDFGSDLEATVYGTVHGNFARVVCTQENDDLCILAHLTGAYTVDSRAKTFLDDLVLLARTKNLSLAGQKIFPKPKELSLLP